MHKHHHHNNDQIKLWLKLNDQIKAWLIHGLQHTVTCCAAFCYNSGQVRI